MQVRGSCGLRAAHGVLRDRHGLQAALLRIRGEFPTCLHRGERFELSFACSRGALQKFSAVNTLAVEEQRFRVPSCGKRIWRNGDGVWKSVGFLVVTRRFHVVRGRKR